MPKLGLGLGLGSLIGRPSGGGGSVVPFSPTDLPNLELWLDANENVLSFVGNKFTDATASVDVNAGVGNYYTGTYENAGNGDYNFQIAGDRSIRKENGVWLLGNNHPEEGYQVEYTSTGNVTYPWQATWPTITVTRTATTNDIQATNDETVARWNNKVSGKPNLNQLTLASRPVFKSDVFGRKAVYFNGDALFNSDFSVFGQEYSYYLVSTSLLGSNTGTTSSAIRLGTSPPTFRGIFGARGIGVVFQEPLAVQNSSEVKEVDASRYITNNNNAGVFSARFNLSAGEVTIGRMLSNFLTTGNNTSTANNTTILIGAGSTSGGTRPIDSNFSEVLVYRAFHDNDTALQVINYLVQKWNIDPNL